MLTHRPSQERGAAEHGWLHAKHSFSFGDYYDPKHMGFRSLRVINEDRIEPKEGFPTHGHKDMEIITYVISGALEHKDSMGNGSIIRPGDVQYMSAGTGVRHSEFNHSTDEVTHLLQIWIVPDKEGHTPRYNQKSFSKVDKTNQLKLVVSGQQNDDVIHVQQDMKLYASFLQAEKTVEYKTQTDRGLWLQLISGELSVNDHKLQAGDGLAIESIAAIQVTAAKDADFLLFDLK